MWRSGRYRRRPPGCAGGWRRVYCRACAASRGRASASAWRPACPETASQSTAHRCWPTPWTASRPSAAPGGACVSLQCIARTSSLSQALRLGRQQPQKCKQTTARIAACMTADQKGTGCRQHGLFAEAANCPETASDQHVLCLQDSAL